MAVDSAVVAGMSARRAAARDAALRARTTTAGPTTPRPASRAARALFTAASILARLRTIAASRQQPLHRRPRRKRRHWSMAKFSKAARKASRFRRIVSQDSPDWNASSVSRSKSSPVAGEPPAPLLVVVGEILGVVGCGQRPRAAHRVRHGRSSRSAISSASRSRRASTSDMRYPRKAEVNLTARRSADRSGPSAWTRESGTVVEDLGHRPAAPGGDHRHGREDPEADHGEQPHHGEIVPCPATPTERLEGQWSSLGSRRSSRRDSSSTRTASSTSSVQCSRSTSLGRCSRRPRPGHASSRGGRAQ